MRIHHAVTLSAALVAAVAILILHNGIVAVVAIIVSLAFYPLEQEDT